MAARTRRSHPHRVHVLALWARDAALLAVGNYNAAVETPAVAYRDDVGDAQLLVLFKRAQRIQSDETVRKAHLQHGHEGPGGTLNPGDVER